jgi:hypothetical protein
MLNADPAAASGNMREGELKNRRKWRERVAAVRGCSLTTVKNDDYSIDGYGQKWKHVYVCRFGDCGCDFEFLDL